jgi:hypothetical protein
LKVVTGRLSVRAYAPNAIIEIDHKPETRGTFDGRLQPGVHEVSVHTPYRESRTLRIAVMAGAEHTVMQRSDMSLESDAALPTPPPPKNETKEREFGPDVPEALYGFYGVAGASLLTIVGTQPTGFERTNDKIFGPAVGGHLGYRVSRWAAFEAFVQGSQVTISGTISGLEAEYELRSIRLAPLLRLMIPGDPPVRFLGAVGVGAIFEKLDWETDATLLPQPRFTNDQGINVFGELELGIELEFSNVLIDVVHQMSIHNTRHFDEDPFDEDPILVTGPTVRVGYGLW